MAIWLGIAVTHLGSVILGMYAWFWGLWLTAHFLKLGEDWFWRQIAVLDPLLLFPLAQFPAVRMSSTLGIVVSNSILIATLLTGILWIARRVARARIYRTKGPGAA